MAHTHPADVVDWRDLAVCAGGDPELWFPPKGDPFRSEQAIMICRGCPVREQCAEDAIVTGVEHGVFGGMTPEERKAERARRRLRRPYRPAVCGTVAAYQRHYRNGEKPCDPCRAAEAVRRAARSLREAAS